MKQFRLLPPGCTCNDERRGGPPKSGCGSWPPQCALAASALVRRSRLSFALPSGRLADAGRGKACGCSYWGTISEPMGALDNDTSGNPDKWVLRGPDRALRGAEGVKNSGQSPGNLHCARKNV